MRDQNRVLIVDDNAAARGALVQILAMEGYQVAEASDGLSALDRVTEFRPEVVLCDLHMPRMDGLTFIARARKLGAAFRLVIMTATHDGGDVAAAIGSEYLAKPIDVASLLRVVKETLEAPACAPGVA
jgi:two-component system response regulator MprA